jgi:MYXO-CTERM domain-containing protein
MWSWQVNRSTCSWILVLFVVTAVSGQVRGDVIVGGFDGGRVLGGNYSIYDPSGANSELTNPANAALYGGTITFAPSTTVATDAYLAGVDIFFTGLISFDAQALSAAEVTSLTNFINGGGFVIAHGDNLGFDQTVDGLLNVFGLDVVNTSNNTSNTTVSIVAPLHPVANGPFGVVNSHQITDSARLVNPASGPGSLIGVYADGFGAIGVVDPGPGRLGGLVFFPDSESYGIREGNFRGLTDARIGFNNAIAFAIANNQPAAVPEPTSLCVWGAGLLGLFVARRRRRQRVQ